MTAMLALAPILVAVALLLFKQKSWIAALAGAAAAAALVALVFPTPTSVLVGSGIDYFPLILEVALILLFGMVLARLLESSGSMSEISSWVESHSPSRSLGVALVVFGIVPFAESVTGFGIGVTIGVPVLRHLGCSLRQSAILGLLGLIAVPWGALGPGTTVAAALAGLDVDDLGLATAWLNAIPVVVVMMAVIAIMRPSPASAPANSNSQQSARSARAASKAPAPAHSYPQQHHPPHHHPSPPSSNASAPQKHRPPNQTQPQSAKRDKIWSTSSSEERERIKEFWLGLGEEERRALVKVEKEAVLKKMKEQQRHSCTCAVCGRKRFVISLSRSS